MARRPRRKRHIARYFSPRPERSTARVHIVNVCRECTAIHARSAPCRTRPRACKRRVDLTDNARDPGCAGVGSGRSCGRPISRRRLTSVRRRTWGADRRFSERRRSACLQPCPDGGNQDAWSLATRIRVSHDARYGRWQLLQPTHAGALAVTAGVVPLRQDARDGRRTSLAGPAALESVWRMVRGPAFAAPPLRCGILPRWLVTRSSRPVATVSEGWWT